MLRYLRALSDKDLALDRTMIPLGSCTMKLNAATEMAAITWPEFADLHPFVPVEQARGYAQLIEELCDALAEVTGYAAVSVQPNAGSQGEFAGLLAIRGYHRSRGDEQRDVCLIPSSAHGTNAASAVMAGMRVVVVACDEAGNVDVADLHAKVDAARRAARRDHDHLPVDARRVRGRHPGDLRAPCTTPAVRSTSTAPTSTRWSGWPSRAGSAPTSATSTCTRPSASRTVAAAPASGPIGVREHLVPFLPGHPLVDTGTVGPGRSPARRGGRPGILPISWAYVRLMGPDGLLAATEHAILAANYVADAAAGALPGALHRRRRAWSPTSASSTSGRSPRRPA